MSGLTKSLLFVLVSLCVIFAAHAQTTSYTLQYHEGSSNWWIAISADGNSVLPTKLEYQDSTMPAFEAMTQTNWGYWIRNPVDSDQIVAPLVYRVTLANGQVFLVDSSAIVPNTAMIGSLSVGQDEKWRKDDDESDDDDDTEWCDPEDDDDDDNHSGNQPSTPTQKPTNAPTSKPTSAPTGKPTNAPTSKPTSAPTSKPTNAPTSKPTSAPTSKPTSAPTSKPTSAPSSGSGCSSPMKIMVPLYAYPGAQWDQLIAVASTVKILAVINPNSGPGGPPDSTYVSYMNKMAAAGIEMVGYVHTSWGARSISEVQGEINTYASFFPKVTGIFLDEGSADKAQLSYYQTLHNYIINTKKYKHNVINPGAVPDQGYTSACTNMVVYEDAQSNINNFKSQSWMTCSNKDMFTFMVHSSSQSGMQTSVDKAASTGNFGYVYVTSGTLSGNTYGTLPSFWSAEASYVASKNK